MNVLDRMVRDQIDIEAAQALENAKLASAIAELAAGKALEDIGDDELSALADRCVFLLMDRNPFFEYDPEPF